MVHPALAVTAARSAPAESRASAAAEAVRLPAAGDAATYALDVRGRISSWDRGAEALYGFSAGEVIGRHPTMLVPPELERERDGLVREALSGQPVTPYQTERLRKDGSRVEVAISLISIRDAAGRTVGASVAVRALEPAGAPAAGRLPGRDGLELSQRKLAEAQERFRIAFLHAPNGIALLSTAPGSHGCFLDANPALGRQLGYESDELIGRCLLDFVHPATRAHAAEALEALLCAGEPGERAERRFVRADGKDVWLQIGASVVRDEAGRPLYAVAHLQDVTDARRHEAELRHLADHDGLTGLVNRRCFGERLETVLADARRRRLPVAVLVVDLDNFKAVNDTLGHAAGDRVLQRVAGALRSRVRAEDVVARLGGDEFGILLTDVSPAQARRVADELAAAVDEEAAGAVGERQIRVTASIGVSTLEATPAATGEALLSSADTAMYQVKNGDRGRVASALRAPQPVFGAGGERRRGAALSARGLELWEQPLLNLASGRHDRVEILLRMRGRRGEIIPAASFVPAFRRFGRARELDAWVLRAAVELVSQRQAAGLASHAEINLDAGSIVDARFTAAIASTLEAAAVDPRAITFGISATSVPDVAAAGPAMAALHRLGCRFALEHFGACAGRLADLTDLPFDTVKIDGTLVEQLPSRPLHQLAIGALVGVARPSGLTTVAEHVGDDATVDLLRELGVDFAQGFHVAAPRPAVAVRALRAAA